MKDPKRYVKTPALLEEIAEQLSGDDSKIAGDSAEIFTKVAEIEPALVVPYASHLIRMLDHKNGRVRWESAHALSLVAKDIPHLIAKKFKQLDEIAHNDESVIVRDYIFDTLVGYASIDPKAASKVLPILKDGTKIANGKHAARILRGLERVAGASPKLSPEIEKLAHDFTGHSKVGIQKAAKALLKKLRS